MAGIVDIVSFFRNLFGGGVAKESQDIRIWMPVFIKQMDKVVIEMNLIARILNRLAALIEAANAGLG